MRLPRDLSSPHGQHGRTQLHAPHGLGDRAADRMAAGLGSWKFVAAQTTLLSGWVIVNLTGILRLDPWPLIFCNLLLSCQAAYSAPILQMSGNRKGQIERARDDHEAETVDRMYEQLHAQNDRGETQHAEILGNLAELRDLLGALIAAIETVDA